MPTVGSGPETAFPSARKRPFNGVAAGQRDVGGMLFRLQPRSLKDFANAGLVNVLINKDRSFPASVKP